MAHQLSDSELKKYSEDLKQESYKRTKNNAILPKLVNELVFLALQEQSAATKNQILYLALHIAQIKNHSAPLLDESKINITLTNPDELQKLAATLKGKEEFHQLLDEILAPLKSIEQAHQGRLKEINANPNDDKTKYEYHKNIIDTLNRISGSLFLFSMLGSLPLLAIQYLALTHFSPVLFAFTGILAGLMFISLLLTATSAALNYFNEKNPYQHAISRENNSFFKDKKAELIHVNNGTIDLCERHLQLNTP